MSYYPPPGFPGNSPYTMGFPMQQPQYAPMPQPMAYAPQQPYSAYPQYAPMQPQYLPAPPMMPQQTFYQPPVQQLQSYPTHGGYAPQPYQMPTSIIPQASLDPVGLPHVPGDMILQSGQTFIVEEKFLSATHDSFIVRDQAGKLRYKVDGTFTINERKSLKDVHGHILLKLREARLKKREKITIFDPSNIAILTLTKTSAIQIGSKRVHGYAGAQTSGTPIVIITGNYNNTLFRVMNGRGQDVAIIKRRKYSLKNMLTDQDTYEVTVNQGSPALLCMITVALDEIYED